MKLLTVLMQNFKIFQNFKMFVLKSTIPDVPFKFQNTALLV